MTFFLPKQSCMAVDCCLQTLQVWFSVWLRSISWLLSLFLEPFAGFKDSTGCIPVLTLEQVPAITLLQSFILTNVLFQHWYFSSRSTKQHSPPNTAVSLVQQYGEQPCHSSHCRRGSCCRNVKDMPSFELVHRYIAKGNGRFLRPVVSLF